ncbi:MAG TPA: CapA family protein [Chloroflexota bacterium]|nr:CapA family protein [Chloroflexota bacterium]
MSNADQATFSLVGDIMIETSLASLRAEQRTGFQAALHELRQSGLVIGNLEMPLSRRGYRVPKHSNLRSDPAVIDDVRAMGIQAVTLANNHMMDYGPQALADTLAACDGAGIVRCGAGMDLEEARRPAWLEVAGRRLALLSVACTLPVESDAAPGKPGIAPLHVGFSFEVDTNLLVEQPGSMPQVHTWTDAREQEAVCRQVAELKSQADMVVVAIHWGVPSYWLSPSQGLLAEYQQPLAHALVEAGADIICGHHSHSLHPIELYQGVPIFYSLGNFLFEGARPFMEPESMIVTITLDRRPTAVLTPLLIDELGLPRLARGDDATLVLEKLQRLSAPSGTTITLDDERGYLPLG